MALYFVSIREGGEHGPTVCAGHFEGGTVTAARAAAITEFLRPTQCPPNADQVTRDFLAGVDATRERCQRVGYVAIARKSRSDAGNALNRAA